MCPGGPVLYVIYEPSGINKNRKTIFAGLIQFSAETRAIFSGFQ